MKGYAFDRSQLSPPSHTPTLPGIEVDRIPAVLAGVDEVGRGPLAGPVVSAAVILSYDSPLIRGLADSKALTAAERERLFKHITRRAVSSAVAIVENGTIDSVNILRASLQSMRECLVALAVKPDLVLVDGNQKPGSGFPERTIIKGDSLSAAIMAASILAKVTRDRIMVEAHEKFPMYGFNKHKGYACKTHIEALREHGPCPLHRLSFDPVRSWISGGAELLTTSS